MGKILVFFFKLWYLPKSGSKSSTSDSTSGRPLPQTSPRNGLEIKDRDTLPKPLFTSTQLPLTQFPPTQQFGDSSTDSDSSDSLR